MSSLQERCDHTARGNVAESGLELGSVKTKTLDGGGVVGGVKNPSAGTTGDG